jgi:hypothetical protein
MMPTVALSVMSAIFLIVELNTPYSMRQKQRIHQQ